MEIEAKYKAELGRLKKKFETDIREYEIQVETLNRTNAELGKANKGIGSRIKVLISYTMLTSAVIVSSCRLSIIDNTISK